MGLVLGWCGGGPWWSVGGLGRRLLRPSWLVVLLVHGGLQVGGVGLVLLKRWVMVVVGMVVLVMAVVLVAVVVVVLWVCTKVPLVL